MNRVRLATGILTGWLVTAWTLPLCCLPMATMATDSPANAPIAAAMTGHEHHHHPVANADTSILRLTSSHSCFVGCQPDTNVAMTATSLQRTHLETHQWIVGSSTRLTLDWSRNSEQPLAGLGPPGGPPQPLSSLTPLRI